MAIVYKQLTKYCQINNTPIPPIEIRKEIGKRIIKAWFFKKNILKDFVCLHKTTITESDGQSYTVLCYPKKFVPVINAIIKQVMAFYLDSISNLKPNNIKRKRIKTKPIPLYSSSKKM
jgi:hypothetical protein